MINIYLLLSIFLSFYFLFHKFMMVNLRSDDFRALLYLISSCLLILISSLIGYREISPMHGGLDTPGYESIFNLMQEGFFSSVLNQRIEKGFSFFLWLVKWSGGDFSVFLFAYSFLLLNLYFYICNKISFTFISISSYFLMTLFVIDSFNISRMILGVFVLFVSVYYLSEKKYFYSICYTLIASSIQMVCLWGFVFILYIYIFNKFKSEKLLKSLMYLFSLLLSFLLVGVFKTVLSSIGYGHYLNDDGGISYLNYAYALFVLIFYFFTNFKDDEISPVSHLIFRLMPTIYFVVPLYYVIPIAYRFNYIYILFFAFLIPDIFNVSLRKIKNKNYFYVVWAILPVVYTLAKSISFFNSSVNSALIWKISDSWYIF
jgi:hypothetical protein